jgi:hypothetical protein
MKNKALVLGFVETDITPSAPIETVGALVEKFRCHAAFCILYRRR